jgi:hypothetical protein
MSTNRQYRPLFSEDMDSAYGDKRSYPPSSLSLSRTDSDELQQGQNIGHKLHKRNIHQPVTDTMTGITFEIPNWPGPQTLEKTQMEMILGSLGYILCLVPPLFFLSKDIICASEIFIEPNSAFYSTSGICHLSRLKGGDSLCNCSPTGVSSGKLLYIGNFYIVYPS